MKDFAGRRCQPLPAGTPALDTAAVEARLKGFPGWTCEEGALRKTFRFADWPRMLLFVNAVGWIAQEEDHHPDLHVGYDRCTVAYHTHSVGGISDNDFICAARIERLFE